MLLALGSTSCGTPSVQVGDAPTLSGAAASDCAALVAATPAKVGDGLAERKVVPASATVRAWGKPAAVLRCGVGVPASYSPGAELQVINDVGWFGETRPDDVVYTTVLRSPRVSLAVPSTQSSSFDVLVDLSAAVAAHSTAVASTS